MPHPVSAMSTNGADVAAAVKGQSELTHETVLLGMLEANRDQDQIHIKRKLGAGNRSEMRLGTYVHSMQLLYVALCIAAEELG